MGKKSRRAKGGVAADVSRKERLQERRQRTLDAAANNNLEQQYDDEDDDSQRRRRRRRYFVGDRVWFGYHLSDGENPNTYRGIVHRVGEHSLGIVTLQSKFYGTNEVWDVDIENVIPDFKDVTLRFNVGDPVVCMTDRGWVPHKVSHQWAIYETRSFSDTRGPEDLVPHYKCRNMSNNGGYTHVAAPSDSDDHLIKHPTTFRFSAGQSVVFNPSLAIGLGMSEDELNNFLDGWVQGSVLRSDVSGRKDCYCVYECSFGSKGKSKCFITQDSDEYIAMVDFDPRDRLLEAISQDCTPHHLSYLAETYSIDISTFRDMVVDRAIEYGSYHTFIWLQENYKFDIHTVLDASGNNLLHQIAKSDRASCFMKRFSYQKIYSSTPYLDVTSIRNNQPSMLNATNSAGKIWLEILVERGDARSLDLALSFNRELSWKICRWDNDGFKLLKECVSKSNDLDLQTIFDEYERNRSILQIYHGLELYGFDTVEEKLVAKDNFTLLRKENEAKTIAARLMRFVGDWEFAEHVRRHTILDVAKRGFSKLFKLFYGADKSFFWEGRCFIYSIEDKGEYIQAELSTYDHESDKMFEAGLLEQCMLGDNFYSLYKLEENSIRIYSMLVERLFSSANLSDYTAFVTYLKKEAEKNSYIGRGYEDILKHKITLLEDAKSLPGRLQILTYLVEDKPEVKLDVLVALRHRQCGVLRWMVEKKLLDLDGDVKSAGLSLANFRFIKRMPSMSLGSFLCFAAVEYDDLFSLQWLCETRSCLDASYEGMNLLHMAALFGRIEITGWLRTTSEWDALVDKSSANKGYDGAFSAHIAASQGHIFLADMLLEFGCNECDSRNKGPECYAKKAPMIASVSVQRNYEHAHDWARERSGEAILDSDHVKNIIKLLQLLKKGKSLKSLREHIIDTQCLDIVLWNRSGFLSFDQVDPNGMSYGQIVDKCLCHHDRKFAVWVITFVTTLGRDHNYIGDIFWRETDAFGGHRTKHKLTQNDLLQWATRESYQIIVDALSHPLIQNVESIDPQNDTIFSLPSMVASDLSEYLRSKLIWARTLAAIKSCIRYKSVTEVVVRGGSPGELAILINIYKDVCYPMDTCEIFLHAYEDETNNHLLEMDMYIPHYSNITIDKHPLSQVLYFSNKSLFERGKLYIVLATEGHTDLVEFCLNHAQGWTPIIEMEMVLVASFFGNSQIVDLFLSNSVSRTFCSQRLDRHYQAMLGATAARRLGDLKQLSMKDDQSALLDPIKKHTKDDVVSQFAILGKSLIGSAIYDYVTSGVHSDHSIIVFLLSKRKYTHVDVLYSFGLVLQVVQYSKNEANAILRFTDLSKFIAREFSIEPMEHQTIYQELIKLVIKFVTERSSQCELTDNFYDVVIEWLELLVNSVDIQDAQFENWFGRDETLKPFFTNLSALKSKQRKHWAQFDVVKKGNNLDEIQDSISRGDLSFNGYDRGGLQLIHLAASFDRADLLKWLVVAKGLDIDATDGRGRTPQQIAEAAKSSSSVSWIIEYKARKLISRFISRNLERIKAIQKHQSIVRNVITIQKLVRGYLTRKLYRGTLFLRLEESQRFNVTWMPYIRLLFNESPYYSGWEAVRSRTCDISHADVDHDTAEKLDDALSRAVLQDTDDESVQEQIDNEPELDSCHCIAKHTISEGTKWSNVFMVTSHVVKFLKSSGDPLYRSFFVRRMQQLANGDRSRILRKRLKGSRSIIFETYLEQKSGFRILWTEEAGTIVVWFVAKHKSVSRFIRLIDDAKSRSARQQFPEDLVKDEDQRPATAKNILLDVGNAPLKVYDLNFDALDDVTKESWTPKLHLTDEERDVVEADGTVLLLGRSGTGKTICICNRMELDRLRFQHDPSFTQLFVSRSSRLCKYVKEVVGSGSTSSMQSFMTFKELLYSLDSSLPRIEDEKSFSSSQHVDYHRFARDFYEPHCSKMKLSALLVWKTIQTFLKGSIEAFQNANHLMEKDYFISGALGKNRCRLDHSDRHSVFQILLDYQKYLDSNGLWDDCDRVISLLVRLEQAKAMNPSAYIAIRRSKVYVDEIQDYSQAECLLYFFIGGPGGLFLAGDPAQSVVESTDFRFEDIRSVGHFVAGSDRRHLIPQKPKTVNINFRSHSGVLNTAAAVLDFLFTQFPSSAKQLKKDHGLFQGPRPGVCHNVGLKKLAALVKGNLKGMVILTHDDSSARWKRTLDYPLVYGIREAKGLEFKSVMILDFFCELPSSLQKPWRELVLNRTEADFPTHYPLVETTLKLLYTGITRSIDQLYFVESSSSIAGDATVRWLTTTTVPKGNKQASGALATKSNISNLDAMVLTCDEWIASGIDNAEMAEDDEMELENALSLLDRSVYCFDQAQSTELATKARAHRQSAQFRLELTKPTSSLSVPGDVGTLEQKAAQLFGSLIVENLFKEAMCLLQASNSIMSSYTQEQLQKEVMPKLQSMI